MSKNEAKTGLDLMREPFPPNLISKLPKPTKAQTDEVKRDYKAGIRCDVCGGWHHPKVVHLDYVGHAALTDRLLDCDPSWNWEPMAFYENGAPALDSNGGLWIKLTVCGQTRLGYGHPDGKQGGDAIKEAIGDALRNAAMRFGAALDLWHKGDLHAKDDGNAGIDNNQPRTQSKTDRPKTKVGEEVRSACYAMGQAQTNAALDKIIDHQKYKALEAECSKDWPDFKQSLDETLKVNRQRLVQVNEPTSEDVEYTTDQYCQKVKAAKTDAEANAIAQDGIRALLNNGADAQYIKAIEDSLKGR